MANPDTLLKELLVVDRNADTPVYLQLAGAVIQHIRQGRFRKGLRLPGSRELGELLRINRMTVVAAYRELDAQGWIEMLPRKGTFVKVSPALAPPKKISEESVVFQLPAIPGFRQEGKRILPVHTPAPSPARHLILNDGFPDLRLAPVDDLVRCIRSQSRRSLNKMKGEPQGTLFLREELTTFLCDTRGLSITPENILVTKGAQMGLYLATTLLIRQQEEVITGTPGYAGANHTFRQLGARINQVAVDKDGLDIDEVERLCKKKKIRIVYVIPHHHHPTTVTLSPQRRIRLLELAARYRFAIVEDDYDYDFHYAGKSMMPMASLDRNGNVIYIGTLTKSLTTSIRVGFIVAPEQFIRTATGLRRVIDSQGDSLIENALAELYRNGTIARHLKKSVKIYKERRDHFCDLLHSELGRHVSFTIPEGGMGVWTRFTSDSLPAVARRAFQKGLLMDNGADYDTEKIKYNSVGFGFASLNFREQINVIEVLKSTFTR